MLLLLKSGEYNDIIRENNMINNHEIEGFRLKMFETQFVLLLLKKPNSFSFLIKIPLAK